MTVVRMALNSADCSAPRRSTWLRATMFLATCQLDGLHLVDLVGHRRVPAPRRLVQADAVYLRDVDRVSVDEDEILDALCLVYPRPGDDGLEGALFRGRGCRFERRRVIEFLGQRGGQRLLLAITEELICERVEEERALLGGLVLGEGQRVERPDVVDEDRVGGALRDQVVQGDHVADGCRVVGDHRQRVLAGLGRFAQLPEVVDLRQHGGHAGLDVRRERAADARGQRPDPAGRRVRRVVPGRECVGVTARADPGRLVAFVLQGLHQAGDLLPEAGELRHAAELGRAAGRRRYSQAAEDQAHDERQHDHRDQPPRDRPVP